MRTYGDPPAILSMFAVLLLIPSGHRLTAVQTHYLLMHTKTYTDTHIRLSSTVNNTACYIYAADSAAVCRNHSNMVLIKPTTQFIVYIMDMSVNYILLPKKTEKYVNYALIQLFHM